MPYPFSSELGPLDDLLSAQYNNLRIDLLHEVSGHDHSGALEHGVKIDHSDLTNVSASQHHNAVTGGDGIAVSGQVVSVDLVAPWPDWSGLEFSDGKLRVNLDANFTWPGIHKFTYAETLFKYAGSTRIAIDSDLDAASILVFRENLGDRWAIYNDGSDGDKLKIYMYPIVGGGDIFAIDHDGNFAFGLTAPLGKVHIDQATDDAAIPVLILDQADVSEGFINFVGSDRGVIAGATASLVSVRAELGGVVYRLALYAND